jgi:hypothetical protein
MDGRDVREEAEVVEAGELVGETEIDGERSARRRGKVKVKVLVVLGSFRVLEKRVEGGRAKRRRRIIINGVPASILRRRDRTFITSMHTPSMNRLNQITFIQGAMNGR